MAKNSIDGLSAHQIENELFPTTMRKANNEDH